MPSAWTLSSPVQQPPPVCRKPPAKLPAPTPEIPTLILQAFIDVKLQLTPGGFRTKALIAIPPATSFTGWLGVTTFPFQNVEIEVTSDPTFELFAVELTALIGPAPVRQFIWTDVELQSREPFILPLLTETVPLVDEFWQVRIVT